MAEIDYELLAFFALSFMIVYSAISVIKAKEIVHSAIWLTLTFSLIGAVYILLTAEYIAVVQILIYAGAVTVLMLFAIMLTKRVIMSVERKREEGTTTRTMFAIVFLYLLAVAIIQCSLDTTQLSPLSSKDLGMALFTTYVMPFALVSLVMLAAMLGGLYLARERKEKKGEKR